MKKVNYSTILGKIKEFEKNLNNTEKGEFLLLRTRENEKVYLKWTDLDRIPHLKEFDTVEESDKEIEKFKNPHVIDIEII